MVLFAPPTSEMSPEEDMSSQMNTAALSDKAPIRIKYSKIVDPPVVPILGRLTPRATKFGSRSLTTVTRCHMAASHADALIHSGSPQEGSASGATRRLYHGAIHSAAVAAEIAAIFRFAARP